MLTRKHVKIIERSCRMRRRIFIDITIHFNSRQEQAEKKNQIRDEEISKVEDSQTKSSLIVNAEILWKKNWHSQAKLIATASNHRTALQRKFYIINEFWRPARWKRIFFLSKQFVIDSWQLIIDYLIIDRISKTPEWRSFLTNSWTHSNWWMKCLIFTSMSTGTRQSEWDYY